MLGRRALFANLNPAEVKKVITAMFIIRCGFMALSAAICNLSPGFWAISRRLEPPSEFIPGTTSPKTKLIKLVPNICCVAMLPIAMLSAVPKRLTVFGDLLRGAFFLRAMATSWDERLMKKCLQVIPGFS
jgi:hypothetical protein|tara:strand:- start:40 stop:429 length:390 start_codon:yes stop_codon:yes gene_type:complete